MDPASYFNSEKRGIAAGLGLVGMIVAVLYSVTHQKPPVPNAYVDGTYRNSDCGTLVFRDRVMTFGTVQVGYTLERRKDDIAAITLHRVGVEANDGGCHVVYDQSQYPMYLSFGRDDPPQSVELWEAGQNVKYDFVRVSPRNTVATVSVGRP